MIPYLFHIGPLYFNFYGFWIAIGVLTFLLTAGRDRIARMYVQQEQLTKLIAFSIVLGIIGGRALSVITYWQDYHSLYEIFAPWEPGYCLQGSIIALMIGIPIYLRIKKIPILAMLDLTGLYAPLMQSIARIGCFFAGCCYGAPTNIPWAITYTHPDTYAVRFIPCHPTQLYSSLSLLILFIFMQTIARRWLHKPGQLFSMYLMGASAERFFNDFLRAEHITNLWQSPDQLLALVLFGIGILMLIWTSFMHSKPYPRS